MPAIADPVLVRFRAALDDAYGPRTERVALFGSRARGDARPHSDCDVAVFLKVDRDFGDELTALVGIGTDFLWDTRAVINASPLAGGACRARTGVMGELRRDGVDL